MSLHGVDRQGCVIFWSFCKGLEIKSVSGYVFKKRVCEFGDKNLFILRSAHAYDRQANWRLYQFSAH